MDSVEDILRLIRTHHKNGVDVIKVMATGGFGTPGSAPWFAQFSTAELRVIVQEAHRLGKNTAAHAHGVEGIRRALDAGIDTLEHVSMFDATLRQSVFDPDLADAIAARGTYVDTTCEWTLPAIVASGAPFRPPVLELYEHGVQLITGTDAGIHNVPHHAFAGGLRALDGFGIPLGEILTAATTRAAAAIGLGDVTGQLTTGFEADVIAVRGNPLTDVATYGKVELIVTRGRRFQPDVLPPLPELDYGAVPAVFADL